MHIININYKNEGVLIYNMALEDGSRWLFDQRKKLLDCLFVILQNILFFTTENSIDRYGSVLKILWYDYVLWEESHLFVTISIILSYMELGGVQINIMCIVKIERQT